MVQKKWSASNCCPKLQNKDGVTVAMVLAAGSCSEDVQRLWLEKWSASDCCPQLQNKDGVTVAMFLARYGSARYGSGDVPLRAHTSPCC